MSRAVIPIARSTSRGAGENVDCALKVGRFMIA